MTNTCEMQGLFDEKELEEKFSEEFVCQPEQSGVLSVCPALSFVFAVVDCNICFCCQPVESGGLKREVLSQGFKPEVKERKLGRKTFNTGNKQVAYL